MSALHRLKAYFGMVPIDELNSRELTAEQFTSHYPAYRSGYPELGHDSHGHDSDHATEQADVRRPHRATFGDYDDGFAPQSFAPQAEHHAPPRTRLTGATSRAPAPVVRGSLAIDERATNLRSKAHHSVAPQRVTAGPRTKPIAEDPMVTDLLVTDQISDDEGAHPLARIVTLHPRNYNEARPIGERYREGNPVIMNLTGMEDRDAKRLVDFAAGLAFALRGSIDKVTNKVFLLSPPNLDVSAEDKRRLAEGRFLV